MLLNRFLSGTQSFHSRLYQTASTHFLAATLWHGPQSPATLSNFELQLFKAESQPIIQLTFPTVNTERNLLTSLHKVYCMKSSKTSGGIKKKKKKENCMWQTSHCQRCLSKGSLSKLQMAGLLQEAAGPLAARPQKVPMAKSVVIQGHHRNFMLKLFQLYKPSFCSSADQSQ